MDHFPIYTGMRVSLGSMQRGYATEFARGATPEALEGVLLTPPVTVQGTEEWLNRLEKNSNSEDVFAVLYHESDEGERKYRYVGHMGLHHIMWPRGSASTGSIIFDTTVHGKGIGTEAKLLLLYHAFYVRHLRTVRSEVKAFNGNSWGHLLKCGYQEVGRVPNFHVHEGGTVDEVLFYVNRELFAPIWEKYKETKELPSLTEEQRAALEKATGRPRPSAQ